MRIDGKAIAEKILTDLTSQVAALKQKGVVPTLAVIQVGDDPGSSAYIKQKKKAAETIGAVVVHSHQPAAIRFQQLQALITKYNNDLAIHGLIVQRPLPGTLHDAGATLANIALTKDVDGFVPGSPFKAPVAMAVITVLEEAKKVTGSRPVKKQGKTPSEIVVIGRGETAGKPIAQALIKQGCKVTVIHSHTAQPDHVIRSADIVISCVGKPRVVTKNNLKPGAILIGIGIWRDDEGKLHGDYEEDDIKDIVAAYTPTPGGVGPVNVACLMQNLVEACIV